MSKKKKGLMASIIGYGLIVLIIVAVLGFGIWVQWFAPCDSLFLKLGKAGDLPARCLVRKG